MDLCLCPLLLVLSHRPCSFESSVVDSCPSPLDKTAL